MRRPRVLLLSMISALLFAILAIGLRIDTRAGSVAPRAPIPASVLAAFQPGEPITNPTQAFVAAQFYLGTTRLRAAGEILPYTAELIRFSEANACTGKPVDLNAYYVPLSQNMKVWLVLFEGQWTIDPPVPDATPGEPEAGCVFVILDTRNNDWMLAGGIRPCAYYQLRPARQIIRDFIRAKGLTALPGTRAYGQLMKGILLGGYPELTGPQPTLVRNQAELDSLLAYAGQHMHDGTWRFWGQPGEPDIPEALVPTGTPIPFGSQPTRSFWPGTPGELPPTETPKPTVSSPLQAIWHSPVITVPLPIPPTETIYAGEWLSEGRLQVKTQSFQSSGLYWIDLAAGDPLISTPRPMPATQQAYSASSLYSVQCGSPLQMIDVANQMVISQVDLILNPNAMSYCTAYVSWDGGEIAAFAARADGEWSTYLWRPDGSAPFRVGPALNGADPPAWSPDGQQFAYLNYPIGEPHTLQIIISDRYGRLLQTVPTNLRLPPTDMGWVGQQVLALRDSNKLWQYYEAETGKLLFTWQEALSMGSSLDNQFPIVSPDGRWFPLERDGSEARSELHKTYSLYDLQIRQEILFYERPWHKLAFSGWSPHGDALYLLHYPVGPDAAADPDLPYGLLAYHPFEGQFELLVENARAVYWDADSHRALVYVLNPDGNGQLTLNAGVWDPTQNRVIGAFPITNPPSQYDFLIAPSALHTIAPAAWSPDGRKAAFLSWQGDLLLMGLDGQTQLLASQVGLGRADFTRLVAWSPEGNHLFVSDRGSVWIVSDPP